MKRVFICYSRTDGAVLEKVKTCFAALEPKSKIEVFSDTALEAGSDWHREIQERIPRTQVAVPLVSQAFFDSPYIAMHELPKMLGADRGQTQIISLKLEACPIEHSRLGRYSCINFSEPYDKAAGTPGRQAELLDTLRRAVQKALDKYLEFPIVQIVRACRGEEPNPTTRDGVLRYESEVPDAWEHWETVLAAAPACGGSIFHWPEWRDLADALDDALIKKENLVDQVCVQLRIPRGQLAPRSVWTPDVAAFLKLLDPRVPAADEQERRARLVRVFAALHADARALPVPGGGDLRHLERLGDWLGAVRGRYGI